MERLRLLLLGIWINVVVTLSGDQLLNGPDLGVIQAKISDFYGKRSVGSHCPSRTVFNSLETYVNPRKYELEAFVSVDHVVNRSWPLLVHSTCLNPNSLGNSLSEYFEARLCAAAARLHYVAAPLLEPAPPKDQMLQKDLPRWYGRIDFSRSRPEYPEDFGPKNPFFSSLASSEIHANPRSVSTFLEKAPSAEQYEQLLDLCPCKYACHENPNSLIFRVNNSRSIGIAFRTAVDEYWSWRTKNFGTALRVRISASANATFRPASGHDFPRSPEQWPAIPDATIHYRCGDNVVGQYGFLPFVAFATHIPKTAKYIYVVSESPRRKMNKKDGRLGLGGHLRCQHILASLEHFLHHAFPQSNVAILRGQSMFDDFSRLSYSRTVICSVSTFCL
eukprot:GSChrysophyteH2.ASY1.ANO1.483.1 assembled CDS